MIYESQYRKMKRTIRGHMEQKKKPLKMHHIWSKFVDPFLFLTRFLLRDSAWLSTISLLRLHPFLRWLYMINSPSILPVFF